MNLIPFYRVVLNPKPEELNVFVATQMDWLPGPGTRALGPMHLLPVRSIPCSSDTVWGPHRSHVVVKTLACPGWGVQSTGVSKKPRLGEPMVQHRDSGCKGVISMTCGAGCP